MTQTYRKIVLIQFLAASIFAKIASDGIWTNHDWIDEAFGVGVENGEVYIIATEFNMEFDNGEIEKGDMIYVRDMNSNFLDMITFDSYFKKGTNQFECELVL